MCMICGLMAGESGQPQRFWAQGGEKLWTPDTPQLFDGSDTPQAITTVSDYTALLSGWTLWGNSAEGTAALPGRAAIVTYSFETAASPAIEGALLNGSQAFRDSLQPFTDAEKAIARNAFDLLAAQTGVIFYEAPAGLGDMRLVNIDLQLSRTNQGAAGMASYPNFYKTSTYVSSEPGFIWIDDTYADLTHLYLHEIGHALGLKHPFQGEYRLTSSLDNTSQTVMSYTGAWGNQLGPIDVSALQYLYGGAANKGTHIASYSWNAATATLTQTGSAAGELIRGVGANDLISALDGNDTIASSAGADTIDGGAGNDIINSGSGADSILGGDGADTVYGGADNDTINGGVGNDTLNGEAGADLAFGDDANDSISGQDGADTLNGGAGLDSLFGNQGDDVLDGGADNDYVYGDQGNDTLSGGLGNDTINGGVGVDSISGGDGGDFIQFDDAGADFADGGAGLDTLYFTTTHPGIVIDLALATQANGARFLNIESFSLTAQADTMIASAAAETIFAGAGNDSINGGDGGDYLSGDAGDDTLVGGGGVDTLAGGAGNDLYIFDAATDFISESINGGIDTLVAQIASYTIQTEIENYRYVGAAALNVTGNAADNIITGIASQLNTINGAGGVDAFEIDFTGTGAVVTASLASVLVSGATRASLTSIERLLINGGGANDSLTGGDGADLLNGGFGIDTMTGGLGDDTYGVSDAADVIIDTGGIDTVRVSGASYVMPAAIEYVQYIGAGGTVTGTAQANAMTGGAGNDVFYALGGNDTVSSSGGADLLFGGDGNDALNGGFGVDSIYGGADNDTINGDDDVDLLFGEGGGDTLNGGAGNDLVLGGDGNDTLNGGADADTILGEAGEDQVNGDAGGDVLWGGSGIDTLNGGDGIDYLYGQDGTDVLLGGADVNVYIGGDGDDVMGAFSGPTASTATATQVFYGETGANLITGGVAGNDSATGGTATDWFIMEAGDDTMLGGAGNDMFYGGDGNDLVDMREGSTTAPTSGDYAWGHGGGDVFLTQVGQAGVEVIMDFEAGAGAGDVVRILGSTYTDFSQMLAGAIESNGFTIVLLGGAEAVYLWNVTKAQLAADDFLFG